MIGLLQRVSAARVEVDGREVAAIGAGLLVLVGVQKDDGEAQAERLLERLLGYRVFPDADGRMNLGLKDAGGGLLLVPQFTLAADTATGSRAGFSTAAEPARARVLFEHLVRLARAAWPATGAGVFGADMKVHLTNDGPVTFWLEARRPGAGLIKPPSGVS
jgi:D-aminoacyl-tRNA deacylase